MEIPPSLKTVLKRLKLSGVLPTLPDRIAYATKTKLGELDLLELILQDEIDRRDHTNLARRLDRAGFDEEQTLEGFDWDAPITFDRDRVRDLFSLGFIERQEDVVFLGPVGVGKTFLACALAPCRVPCRPRRPLPTCRPPPPGPPPGPRRSLHREGLPPAPCPRRPHH